ncbi:undecaprenyl-diphosphate phosphatase [bacterium]|nr:undecaprenyl-diphosphate phosphatase [bacterium]
MTLLQAIILGIVEGLTEYLPVSSTGHLILANALLGLDGAAVDSYIIVIQLGAILAVAVYYRERVLGLFRGIFGRDASGRRLLINLFLAFLPAAIVGLLLGDVIQATLFFPGIVAVALIDGGFIMIAAEKLLEGDRHQRDSIDEIKPVDALLVGVAQCFALIPGTSRSMTTIVGGQLRGFSNSLAADFSFLLALPTLGAATIYSLIKNRDALMQMDGGLLAVLVGLVVSFFVAWAAIAWFLKVVKRIGMAPFGIYRIVVGVATIALVLAGWL